MSYLTHIGYSVTAEHTGADHANTGKNLPLGMCFVLRKHGEKITEHTSHTLAWAWATRLEERKTQ